MKAGTSPERAGSLVIELAARTAIVDGKRVELPPTEFSLLAVLAARPGQVVPHKELLAEAFGDSAVMTRDDLQWRIWKIRDLLGDKDREKRIVANRRGMGYLIDLPPSAVEVIEGVAEEAVEPAVIHLDEPDAEDAQPQETDTGVIAIDALTSPAPRRFLLRPGSVLVAASVAALALGGSWLAGYQLSKRGDEARSDTGPPVAEAAPNPQEPEEPEGKGDKPRREQGRKTNTGRSTTREQATAAGTGSGSVSGDSPGAVKAPAPKPKTGGDKQQNPPPPQPDAQLYHLFNPQTDDHLMTTSSATANQKQAEGYTSTIEGKVFSKQEKGTVAVALDSGTAYIYRSRDAVPQGVSVVELYRLTKDGDFFYTRSSSAANQAEAQGWSRSVAGLVQ